MEALFNFFTYLTFKVGYYPRVFEKAQSVKSLRDEFGLSQVEFAKLVGKPQSIISRIEAGEMNPSFQLLNEIADKTNKKIEIKFV